MAEALHGDQRMSAEYLHCNDRFEWKADIPASP
jgi:hypothetical protein